MKNNNYIIDYYPTSDKPEVREKVLKYGTIGTSDIELLMVLLGKGKKGLPIAKLAERVLQVLYSTNKDNLSDELLKIDGMGPGKTALILAALECGKRFLVKPKTKISSVKDIVPLIQFYGMQKQEHFICITLNGAHEVINIIVISVGTLNKSVIHPREIFLPAISDRAAAIVIAHNHPSGSLEPSKEDFVCTRRILDSSKILGIPLLDHLIISKYGYYSFFENTNLFEKTIDL
jgi:DNA repair protein RadC